MGDELFGHALVDEIDGLGANTGEMLRGYKNRHTLPLEFELIGLADVQKGVVIELDLLALDLLVGRIEKNGRELEASTDKGRNAMASTVGNAECRAVLRVRNAELKSPLEELGIAGTIYAMTAPFSLKQGFF